MPSLLAVLVALACLTPSPCAAHPAAIAAATAKVSADGHFEVQARFDLLAFALDDTPLRIGDGPMNALLDGPPGALQAQLAEAEHRFREDFQVSGGTGPGALDAVVFPSVADVQQWRDSGMKPRLPVMMNVVAQGHLPPGATSVSFRFPEVLGMIVVTTELPYQEPVTEPVEGGAFSTPVALAAPASASATPAAPPANPAPAASPIVSVTKLAAPVALPTRPVKKPALSLLPRLERKAPNPNSGEPEKNAERQGAEGQGAEGQGAEGQGAEGQGGEKQGGGTPPLRAERVGARSPRPLSPRPFPSGSPTPAKTAAKPAVIAAPTPPINAAPTPPIARPAWGTLVFRYMEMGFTHILPEGLDHILFVLGLFLLSTRLKPLLWQITAFTVAHSLTLALSLYGIVRLPPAVIEPVIAASIAFVAIENLFTTDLKPWRPFVVFGFGLVHGMGFAGALRDLGLQRHDFLTALVGFNAGVELGQMSVVGMALLAVGWFRSSPSYRRLVVVPASVMIAAVAVFWTIQRVL